MSNKDKDNIVVQTKASDVIVNQSCILVAHNVAMGKTVFDHEKLEAIRNRKGE